MTYMLLSFLSLWHFPEDANERFQVKLRAGALLPTIFLSIDLLFGMLILENEYKIWRIFFKVLRVVT